MPSSLSWRRVTKIRGATCGRPKVKTSCARSTPPDRRSPPSSPTVTLFKRRHTSAPVRLVQETAEQLGILLIYPVDGSADTGVLLVAHRMGTFLEGVLAPFESSVCRFRRSRPLIPR